jgi:hypothetical protein
MYYGWLKAAVNAYVCFFLYEGTCVCVCACVSVCVYVCVQRDRIEVKEEEKERVKRVKVGKTVKERKK